jgi:hypothetical protein
MDRKEMERDLANARPASFGTPGAERVPVHQHAAYEKHFAARMNAKKGLEDLRAKVGEGAYVDVVLSLLLVNIATLEKRVNELVAERERNAKLEARLAEVESKYLHPGGVWQAATAYKRGAMVTYSGSSWHACRDTCAERPGDGSTAWQLAVKGRDALTERSFSSPAAQRNGSTPGVATDRS